MVKQSCKNISAVKMVTSRVAALIAALILACSLAGCASGADNSSSNASSSSAVSSSSSSSSSSSASSSNKVAPNLENDVVAIGVDDNGNAFAVQVLIEAPDVADFDSIDTKQAPITDDSTALSTLEWACKYAGLEAPVVEDGSYGSFVTSIDGLANGDYGTQSGWTYTVNGEYATVSAGEYKVKMGDNIVWTYMM